MLKMNKRDTKLLTGLITVLLRAKQYFYNIGVICKSSGEEEETRLYLMCQCQFL